MCIACGVLGGDIRDSDNTDDDLCSVTKTCGECGEKDSVISFTLASDLLIALRSQGELGSISKYVDTTDFIYEL